MYEEEEELWEEFIDDDGNLSYAPMGSYDPGTQSASSLDRTPPPEPEPTPFEYEDSDNPGLIDRFTGAFAEAFEGGMLSLPAGVEAGYADFAGHEDAFDAANREISDIQKRAARHNPNTSSWEEVKEDYSKGGLFPAAAEILDLTAQGLGGSFGWMAPSAALMAGGYAAAASAPFVAAAAMGAAGLMSFTQYFTEQMETSYRVASEDGKKEVDTEDIDLANTMLSAAGQAALEQVTPGRLFGAKLLTRMGKNKQVTDAANTAIAQTLAKASQKVGTRRLQAAIGIIGTESFTEQGQNLLQRATAGQPIDPRNQEMYNSVVETFVSTLLVAGAFGGVAAAQVKSPKKEGTAEVTEEDVSATSTVVEETDPAPAPVVPGEETTEETYRRQAAENALRARSNAAALETATAEATAEVEGFGGLERTEADVEAILADRNIDTTGSDAADAGYVRLLQRETGKTLLSEATPQEIERVYKSIEVLPRSENQATLPLTDEAEALSVGKRLGKKAKSREKMIEGIKNKIKKEDTAYTTDAHMDIRAEAIYQNLEQQGLITEINGNVKVDTEVLSFVGKKDVQEVLATVESLAEETTYQETPSGGSFETTGEFPSWKRVQANSNIKKKALYDKVKKFLIERGVVRKSGNKFFYSQFIESDPRATPEGSALTPASRVEYERSKAPVKKFVVRDDAGAIVPGGIFKSKAKADQFVKEGKYVAKDANGKPIGIFTNKVKANKFIKQNPGSSIVNVTSVTAERGYVIKETTFRDKGKGERVDKSVPRDFVQLGSTDSKARADEVTERLNEEMEASKSENRAEFLAGEEIQGENARTVRLARSREADDRHEAHRRIMESPVSIQSVVNQYGYGLDPTSTEHLENVKANESVVTKSEADAAAETQRGEPEDFAMHMQNIVDTDGHRVIPSLIQRITEHVGDLAHRVQDSYAFIDDIRDKLNIILDYPSASHLRAVMEGYSNDAEYHLSLKDDEHSALYREDRRAFRKKYAGEITRRMLLAKTTTDESLTEYARLHEVHSKPVTEMGRLGKQIAVDLGNRNYESAIENARKLDAILRKYEEAHAHWKQQSKGGLADKNSIRADEIRLAKRIDPEPVTNPSKTLDPSVLENIAPDSATEEWGTLPFNAYGEDTGGNAQVRVKEGHIDSEGKGFGRKRLDAQNESIAAKTKFRSWREMTSAFLNKISYKPDMFKTGEAVGFSEGPGRTVVIWRDPLSEEPITFVFDHYQEGDTSEFSLYNAFVGEDYKDNIEDFETLKGLHGKRGKPSVSAVAAAEHPESANKYTASDRQRDSLALPERGPVAEESVELTIAEKAAVSLRKATPLELAVYEPKGLVRMMSDAYAYFRSEEALERLRKHIVDSLDPLVKSDMRVRDETGELLFVDAAAESAGRMIDTSIHMFYAQVSKGNIRYVRSEDDSPVNGVFMPTEETQNVLSNKSEPTLIYNDETKNYEVRVFEANLHTEAKGNLTGGIETIYQSMSKPDQNLTGLMNEFAEGLRAYNIATEGGTVPFGKGKSVPMNEAEVQRRMALGKQFPEIVVAHSNMQKWNDQLIQLLEDTSVISAEEAAHWRKYRDYTPFYLDSHADANAFVAKKWEESQQFASKKRKLTALKNFDPRIAYTGIKEMEDIDVSERLIDPVEATFRNAIGIATAATRNVSVLRAIRNEIVQGTARPWRSSDAKGSRPVTVRENGVEVKYWVQDELLVETIIGGKPSGILGELLNTKFVDVLGRIPANFLRETVTRNPGFVIPNVIRDSMAAWMINGGDPRILIRVWGRVIKNSTALLKNNPDGFTKGYKDLQRLGITNGFDHNNVPGDHRKASKKLKEQAGMSKKKSKLLGMRAIWNAMGAVSAASESATREVVYEHVQKNTYDRLIKDGKKSDDALILSQAEGAYQAREIMNFSRKGDSNSLRVIATMAPFVNARIQGMDVLARTGMKIRPVGYDRLTPDEVFGNLKRRGAVIATGSAALAVYNFGEDEYEREDGNRRDDNWFVPILGVLNYITFPIPFELGIFFKTIPEQMTRMVLKALVGETEGGIRDGWRATKHALTSNFGLGTMIPVSARPFIELSMNRNLHTGIPIDPVWQNGWDDHKKYDHRTSAQAVMIGQATGRLPFMSMSPRFIDNVVGTIGGGVATNLWGLMDHMIRFPGAIVDDYPFTPKAVPGVRDIMLVRRILSDPNTARGTINEYHEFKASLDVAYDYIRTAKGSDEDIRDEHAAAEDVKADMQSIGHYMKLLKTESERIGRNVDNLSVSEMRSRERQLNEERHELMLEYLRIRKYYDSIN